MHSSDIATNEQQAVVHTSVVCRANATVDAVAGSGKTTTVRFVATKMEEVRPTEHTLMLTYSRRLKDDAEENLAKRARRAAAEQEARRRADHAEIRHHVRAGDRGRRLG